LTNLTNLTKGQAGRIIYTDIIPGSHYLNSGISTLFQHLLLYSDAECIDPRDKAYSLLSLLL
jgi:hypothetical protein